MLHTHTHTQIEWNTEHTAATQNILLYLWNCCLTAQFVLLCTLCCVAGGGGGGALLYFMMPLKALGLSVIFVLYLPFSCKHFDLLALVVIFVVVSPRYCSMKVDRMEFWEM